jgi:hypothetical protein
MNIARQISLKLRRRRAFSKLTKKETSPQPSPKEKEESGDTIFEKELGE